MPYVEGFVIPVPQANRQAYLELVQQVWPRFQALGAVSLTECWGDDVPDGKLTDFRRAVAATPDEAVVFSWIVWPDKATRAAAQAALIADPDMDGPIPFDGKRMIYGGFVPVFTSEA